MRETTTISSWPIAILDQNNTIIDPKSWNVRLDTPIPDCLSAPPVQLNALAVNLIHLREVR